VAAERAEAGVEAGADADVAAGVPPAHPAMVAVTAMARAMAVIRGPFPRNRILL
jgi:hypothetical protein